MFWFSVFIKKIFIPNWYYITIIYSGFTIVWAAFIIPYLRKQIWVKNKILREPPMKDFSKVESVARYDWIEWPRYKIYFGGIFFFIPRITFFISGCAFGWVLHATDRLLFGAKGVYDEQPPTWHWIKQFWKPFLMRTLSWLTATNSTQYKSHKISDYLSDYKKYEKDMEGVFPPISISNHVTGIDMITLLDIFPCLSF